MEQKKKEENKNLPSNTQKSEIKWEEITENGGIELRFIGKANSLRIVRKVKPRLLKEIQQLSLGNEEQKSKNLVIEGDNLLSMATLYQYHGKIDLIIADPPYNTGKDFRYNDKWDQDPNDPGLGDYVKADDPSRHTKWMKFMLPRIQTMKSMLKSTGILAICIDYRELVRLMQLLDEIFGEENRIAIINWQKTTVNSMVKHVSVCVENVLVYAKKKENAETNLLPKFDKDFDNYKNPDNDPLGSWNQSPATAKDLTSNNKNIYAIQNPFSGELIYPGRDATSQGRDWSNTKENMEKWLEEWGMKYEKRDLKDGVFPALVIKGFRDFSNPQQDPLMKISYQKAQERLAKGNWPKLVFSKQGLGRPGTKRYLKDVKEGKVTTDYWNEEDSISISLDSEFGGSSITAIYELRERVNEQFIGVKPLKLFTKIIQLWCPPSGLVMDPFAGTGTTGEAVLQLNKIGEQKRSFILIEQGFNPKEEDDKEKNWCRTLLQKRLKAVITGQWADGKEHESLGGGFRFYELTKQVDSSTILQMEKQELIETILSSNLNHISLPNNNYLIAKNKQGEGIYLIWINSDEKIESKITEDVYYQCALERKKYGLEPIYHIYARTITYQSPTIIFHKIPDKVLIDFGIDPNTDTFINKEEE